MVVAVALVPFLQDTSPSPRIEVLQVCKLLSSAKTTLFALRNPGSGTSVALRYATLRGLGAGSARARGLDAGLRVACGLGAGRFVGLIACVLGDQRAKITFT